MYKTRKIGFGLAAVFGLMLTVPAMAQDPVNLPSNISPRRRRPLRSISSWARRYARDMRSSKRTPSLVPTRALH